MPTEPPELPVAFTPAARDDLAGIVAYRAAQRGTDAGEALLDSLLDRAQALRQFPNRGARPKELLGQGEENIRQIIATPYRMIYEVQPERVLFILIADGRRDMQRLLRERLLGQPVPDE